LSSSSASLGAATILFPRAFALSTRSSLSASSEAGTAIHVSGMQTIAGGGLLVITMEQVVGMASRVRPFERSCVAIRTLAESFTGA